ncbi:MAG: hypothetical protein ACHQHN_02195 [Sphingobacteriales bacterium]
MLIGKQFVVSRLVHQYLNNRQNEILWKLLANPADNGHLYGYNLQQLVKDFPQSGLLQALLARANKGEGMHHAAASFNPKVLYVMMNAYDNLADVSNGQIIQQLSNSVNYAGVSETGQAPDLNDFSGSQLKDLLGFEPENGQKEGPGGKVIIGDDEQKEVEIIASQQATEPELANPDATVETEQADEQQMEQLIELPDVETEEEPTEQIEEITDKTEPAAELPAEDNKAEMHSLPFEEEIIERHERVTETVAEEIEEAPEHEPVTEAPADDHKVEMHNLPFEEEIIEFEELEDETLSLEADEEAAIEPGIEPAPQDFYPEKETPAFEEEISSMVNDGEQADIKNTTELPEGIDDEVYDEIADIDFSSMFPRKVTEETVPEVAIASAEQLDELIPESMAGTDYFVFEKAEPVSTQPEVVENETFIQEYEPVAAQPVLEAETNNVSKYHDEKMPYSFMWWLDKTRKEHAGVYQPFKLDTSQAIRHTADDTLQQQYYENIFHVTTVAELDASKQTIPFDPENKEDQMIKKFIIEEPHIGAPSSDKLDNENKAKKSAVDQDEIVTETLARIYVDQMLYHKAINTYKKLVLKFPEKSRYFADQIELLERKIN